jgi:DNA mismatch repair ATPase MutS
MCINKVIEFADFMSFYHKYKPLTPYGTDSKDAMPFYTDQKELDGHHQIIDRLMDFINSDENKVLKTENHLCHIDRLNSFDRIEFDVVDLHLIKKFLIHFKGIDSLLNDNIKEAIGFNCNLDELLKALTPDNDSSESFYLSASFDNKLKAVRNTIVELDAQLNAHQQETILRIKDRHQLSFNGRDFVLVDKQRTELFEDNELNCEFYDSYMLKVKPVYGKNYLNTLLEKEQVLVQEAEIEQNILSRLSELIHQSKDKLVNAINAIGLLDTSLTKARMAVRLNLTKPDYKATCIKIKEGMFYPLWEKHTNKGLTYTSLNASFDSNTIVLSGSNMGGKTVLFRTLAFLQLLTQLGFRVPATEFRTRIYSSIHVLGTAPTSIEGLSSFGHEIHQLTKAFEGDAPRLLLVDELAKTTSATEAKAILYAVLKYTVQNKSITGFFSTHFINIPEIEGVLKFRMKGLNRQAFENHCAQQSEDIHERIRLINAFMQYEVIEDNEQQSTKDALTIAELLGLNSEILKNANDFLKRK